MLHLLYGGADSTIINNFNNDCKMSKRHDENRDLRSFSRIGKVDYSNKTLQCSKNATIGIHLWGKIDFLTKYCGWFFMWNNSAGTGGYVGNDDSKTKRELKKAKKEPKLTDKTKKGKKK